MVANQKKNCGYQAGNVFENIDQLVKIEGEDVSVGSSQ
jgi:hypothetical protein